MSWIKRRPLLALGMLAFFLRASCAVVTEYKPIFPAYYYTDANMIHAYALNALQDVRAGRAPLIIGTLSERIQTLMTLEVYGVLGPRPFAIKLINALLGALGIVAFAWAMTAAFSFQAALAAALLVSLWPSHVFYTSQNLKEAPTNLLAYLALGAALGIAAAPERQRARPAGLAVLASCFLLGAGFYRAYVLLCLSGALLVAFALMAVKRPSRVRALLGAVAVALALAFYPWMSRRIYLSFNMEELSESGHPLPRLIPLTYDDFGPGTVNRPTSPAAITTFRKVRQFSDRRWARSNSGREIGTQIHPDAEFKTWGDMLAYLPKGAFTVLFMPLPGLYPMDGKLGRFAAAGENLILLVLAALAAAGFVRGAKTPARFGLLAFFTAMTAGAALLEFDLGSAGRHKLLYLPMLFPFAAEEVLRLLGKEPA